MKILSLILCMLLPAMLLSMSFIAAESYTLNFDSIKSQYGIYELKKCEGFFTELFCNIGLSTGTTTKKVSLDKKEASIINCYAEGTTTLYENGVLFTDNYFKDLWGNVVTIENQIYYYVNESYQEDDPLYKEVCESFENKTTLKQEQSCHRELLSVGKITKYHEYWKPYNFEVLPSGFYRWKLEGKRKPNQGIDFIFKLDNNLETTQWSWWNASWLNKRNISNLTNYISIINISYNASMKTDFADLRFTDSSETQELNYWIEKKIDSSWALVRVRNNYNTSIFVYYGSPSAASTSNVSNLYNGNLLLFMDMNDQAGQNVTDATNNNNATWQQTSNWTSGKFNGGVGLNGSNFIYALDNDVMDALYNITILAWLLPTSVNPANNQRILTKDANGTANNFVYSQSFDITTTNELCMQLIGSPSTAKCSQNSSLVTSGAWRFLATSWRGTDGTIRHYADGFNLTITYNDADFAGPTQSTNGRIMIGARYFTTPTQFYKGEMDDIMLFNRTLSREEIANIYNTSIPNYVIGNEQSLDLFPNVTANSPADNNITSSNTVIFNCSATDDFGIYNITLNVNSTSTYSVQNTTAAQKNISIQVTKTDMNYGNSTWNCSVLDTSAQTNSSANRNIWVQDYPIVTSNYPPDLYSTNTSFIEFNCSSTSPLTGLINTTLILDGINNVTVTNSTATNLSLGLVYNVTGLALGDHTWNCSSSNFAGRKNSSATRTFTISDRPVVTLNTPPANYTTITNSILFNCSVTSLIALTNLTLRFNTVANYTVYNTTANQLSMSLQATRNISSGSTTWGCDAYNIDNDNTQRNTTITKTTYRFNSMTSNFSDYVTNAVEFVVNVSYDTARYNRAEVNFYSNLIQNITPFPKDYVLENQAGNGEGIFRKWIDMPNVSGNYEFYVAVLLYQDDNNSVFVDLEPINDMYTYTASISDLNFTECSPSVTYSVITFKTYDQDTLEEITPFDFKSTYSYYFGNGTTYKTVSLNISSTIEADICVDQRVLNPKVIGTVQYSNANYSTGNYEFGNALINASDDINIPLFFTNLSLVTPFIVKVQDTSQMPLPGYYVYSYRYHPETGTSDLIGSFRADSNGQGIGFFIPYTVDYYFVVKDPSGNTVLTTSRAKAIPTTTPYTITLTVGTNLPSPFSYQDNITGVSYQLSYNKNTFVVTYLYSDSNSSFESGRLIVRGLNLSGSNNIICNTSSTDNPHVLTCNLTGNLTGTYSATGYITRSSVSYIVNQIIFNIADNYGMLGILGGFFIILICCFLFAFNEVAGIIMVNVGIIFVNLMGFINFGGVFVTVTVCISIILLIVLER